VPATSLGGSKQPLGALDDGATEMVVNDLHGARGGFNLVPEELYECAKYVTGPRTCRMAGIDESFNIAFMIGYHAMAGTKGAVLDHTLLATITTLTCNLESPV